MIKHSRMIRTLAALLLTLALCLSTALAEDTMSAELQAAMDAEADRMLNPSTLLNLTTAYDLYENTDWSNTFTAFPEKFDLREQNIVPEVRDQKRWGTCWGFASIAACETSLLSKYGMTTQEFQDRFGLAMNLSEKHLAWFGTGRMPALDAYPDGEYVYPTLESQAGEGIHRTDEEEQGQAARYNNGGGMTYSSGIFAAGEGPVFEYQAPYTAADGSDSTAGDWTLNDSERFGMAFELENSALLPSPAQHAADGSYLYNAAGTQAIKSELLAGRGVTIGYHADLAMDPKSALIRFKDRLIAMGIECTDEQAQRVLDARNGAVDRHTLTDDEFILYMRYDMARNGADPAAFDEADVLARREEILAQFDEAAAQSQASAETDAASQAAAEKASQKAAEEMGVDYDSYIAARERTKAADQEVYINTDNYAQYTDTADALPTHAVTIVGWDDTYSASHFLANHQPPADGAWIVRNSWGATYGNEGYFYLSYYDETICMVETFEFVKSDLDNDVSQVDIMGYDFMQADAVNVVQMKESTALANVFEMEDDNILSYISVLTAAKDTTVTAEVYLLKEDAASPVDGTMLDVVTETYRYGGYHRIALNHNFFVSAGAKVSVVQVQRVGSSKEMVYAVPYTASTNHKFLETQNVLEPDEKKKMKIWFEGQIGKGESFVCLDGVWADWSDVMAQLQEYGNAASYFSYDNLNMKLYAYSPSELEALHRLSEPICFNGAQAQVCSDCGYTIVRQ